MVKGNSTFGLLRISKPGLSSSLWMFRSTICRKCNLSAGKNDGNATTKTAGILMHSLETGLDHSVVIRMSGTSDFLSLLHGMVTPESFISAKPGPGVWIHWSGDFLEKYPLYSILMRWTSIWSSMNCKISQHIASSLFSMNISNHFSKCAELSGWYNSCGVHLVDFKGGQRRSSSSHASRWDCWLRFSVPEWA